jgi:hypothetical protein
VATTPTKGDNKMNKQIEKELAKVITKCLLNDGHDIRAIEFVLSKYDLTSYLLDEPLRIITEQVEAVSEAVSI